MSEPQENSGAGQGSGPEEPKKPMSKIEAIRAAAAAKKAAAGGEAAAKEESAVTSAIEVKEKPARPLPPKPAKPKGAVPIASATRRSFLSWIGIAWGAFTAGCATAVLAGVR